jgi:hypothetical protein
MAMGGAGAGAHRTEAAGRRPRRAAPPMSGQAARRARRPRWGASPPAVPGARGRRDSGAGWWQRRPTAPRRSPAARAQCACARARPARSPPSPRLRCPRLPAKAASSAHHRRACACCRATCHQSLRPQTCLPRRGSPPEPEPEVADARFWWLVGRAARGPGQPASASASTASAGRESAIMDRENTCLRCSSAIQVGSAKRANGSNVYKSSQ